ncbi:aminotransferase-like domain-containing protein [Massilia rubra]|uniref:PLP-dependent aminotransferase family protein n=1 Tax=Massilia rubra TaxID=2607910 RepID=A0ABX0LET2_9BURK|nr:PLP-dependent aminotransferase family protein [Massilia rubra]NHZ33326.1 PLP-dependent aminotransferase family protein [Massilia rubra]
MQIANTKLNLALGDAKVEVMNFLNEIAMRYPDCISFAPGRPREEFFDVAAALGYVQDFVDYRGTGDEAGYAELGQYGRTNGMLGQLIATLLERDESVSVEPQDIVVTVGCQEAMCICLIALCGNPGDVALVADPAYIGISGAASLLGIEVAAVATDSQGVHPAGLEAQLAALRAAGKTPRILYLSPDFANPTGASTPSERRAQLLDLTRRHGVLVLEDHAYNYFCYDEQKLPCLKSTPEADHVLFLGSFSKSIFPGLRLGFIAAGQVVTWADGRTCRLADELSKVKSLLTVNTSPINQAIVGGILLRNACSLHGFVAPRRAALLASRDSMLAALRTHFPPDAAWTAGVSWTAPSGGFFLSMTLPFIVTSEDLLLSAREYGVLWTPMSYFYLDQRATREIRLSFSYVTPAQIDKGIAALARQVMQQVHMREAA